MTITPTKKDFIISFPYHVGILADVKAIPGRWYNKPSKAWHVPIEAEDHVQRLQSKYKYLAATSTADVPVIQTIPELPDLDFEIPLKRNPFDYQKKGIARGMQLKRFINGDEPGLGKSGMAIATLHGAALKGELTFPCLIICPTSLKENWAREWALWTDRKAIVMRDSMRNTWHQYLKTGLADVLIVNYESLKKYFVAEINKPEASPLTLKHVRFKESINLFQSVVIDELHRVKDSSTQQAKFTKGLSSNKKWILGLTGTPVVNKPKDLISQLAIIERLVDMGGYKYFMNRYCGGNGSGATNLKELQYKLGTTCFFQRQKKDVLKDLPDKMRQIILCDITTRKEYQDAIKDLSNYLAEYKSKSEAEVEKSMRGEIMVKIGVCKNISARGKLNEVCEHINEVLEAGEKIVVFIHQKEIAESLLKVYPHAVTIRGMDTPETRQRNVDSFQKDKKTNLIICNIKAGGVGITLTASSRVAFVELPWHAADCNQAEDRCIVEGELILTPSGWVAVETLKTGDEVISRYGNPCIIRDAWSIGNTKLITEIKVEGFGITKTTNDHRYLTENGDWVEACKLLPGMKLQMPSNSTDCIDTTEYLFPESCRVSNEFLGANDSIVRNGRLKKAPETIQITDDFLFLCGYYVGDGFSSIQPGKGRFVSVAGNKNGKMKHIERCRSWFERQGLKCGLKVDGNEGNGVELRAYSAEWAYFFHQQFGHYAKNKKLPAWLMELSKRQSTVLLSGLMASDGYYRKGRYEFVTSSSQLSAQVFILVLKAGYRPTVAKNTTGQSIIAYAESQTDPFALVQSVSTYYPKKTNGKRPLVYDLTTDSTESFVLGSTVVHNCHRIGQKGSVQCTYFLGHGTIDEDIYKIIEKKREVANSITGSEDNTEKEIIDRITESLLNTKF